MGIAAKLFTCLVSIYVTDAAQANQIPEFSLSSPMSTLIPREDWGFVNADLARYCGNSQLTLEFPIEMFITKSFYDTCIAGILPRESMFVYVSEFEKYLRTRLAGRWLALNMSDKEIQLAKREPQNVKFKPLKFIDFKRFGHVTLPRRAAALEAAGIFLVRDFIKAYKFEMSLRQPNFDRLPSLGKKSIIDMKLAIDDELQNKGVSVPMDEVTLQTKTWLEETRTLNAKNPNITDACEVLLKYLLQASAHN